MNNFNASLAPFIIRFALIASACLWMPFAQADDLKDISQLADQGQTALALERVNTFIVANPENTQALFMKGVFLAEQGRRDEAIKTFTDITEKSPTLPEPYNNLAVLYADKGQFDKARKALETAIKTHPSYATAHENLGDIYARMASDAYNKALQIDTSNARAQGKLSLIKDLFGTNSKISVASKETKQNNTSLPSTTKSTDVALNKNSKLQTDTPNKTEATPIKNINTQKSEIKKADVIINDKVADNNPADTNEALTTTVNLWAQAWASKNLDQYFASYGNSFKPEKGLTRQAWEKQRHLRITSPASINIELKDINIESNDNDAKVKFRQYYSANGKSISTNKTLHMKKSGSNWYIVREVAG